MVPWSARSIPVDSDLPEVCFPVDLLVGESRAPSGSRFPFLEYLSRDNPLLLQRSGLSQGPPTPVDLRAGVSTSLCSVDPRALHPPALSSSIRTSSTQKRTTRVPVVGLVSTTASLPSISSAAQMTTMTSLQLPPHSHVEWVSQR